MRGLTLTPIPTLSRSRRLTVWICSPFLEWQGQLWTSSSSKLVMELFTYLGLCPIRLSALSAKSENTRQDHESKIRSGTCLLNMTQELLPCTHATRAITRPAMLSLLEGMRKVVVHLMRASLWKEPQLWVMKSRSCIQVAHADAPYASGAQRAREQSLSSPLNIICLEYMVSLQSADGNVGNARQMEMDTSLKRITKHI